MGCDMDEGQLEFRRELGARIGLAAGLFPTKSAAATAAGITLEQFNKWIRGEVKVPVESLKELAFLAKVDFVWLVCGEERSEPPPTHNLGGRELETIERRVSALVTRHSEKLSRPLAQEVVKRNAAEWLAVLLRKAGQGPTSRSRCP